MNNVIFSKALADQTRQKIMDLTCCRWLNVSQIVEALDVSQPTVSHHLAILKEADLVVVRKAGKETFYTLNQERLASGCCSLAEQFAPDLQLTLTPKP
ncbi:MAG: metalloregulator ArsR/SmtB family transcription factor [Anaerolineales bacterium]|nr:metalloregulator ArsR/SmtB family transcription factor [Anaerolineales bacterium]